MFGGIAFSEGLYRREKSIPIGTAFLVLSETTPANAEGKADRKDRSRGIHPHIPAGFTSRSEGLSATGAVSIWFITDMYFVFHISEGRENVGNVLVTEEHHVMKSGGHQPRLQDRFA